MIFKRKLYDKMLEWKREFDGKTALLIKGARRVGKSTLVEEFAKQEYESDIPMGPGRCCHDPDASGGLRKNGFPWG